MKKLMILAILMVAIGVNAQLATYSVAKTQLTVDGTWEDFSVEDASDQSILVIYNFGENKIHITNRDQSIFFLTSSENLDDYTDDDGDIMKSVHLSAWDEEGLNVNIGFKWWENEDITFSNNVTTIMSVYNKEYWIRYYLIIEGYKKD